MKLGGRDLPEQDGGGGVQSIAGPVPFGDRRLSRGCEGGYGELSKDQVARHPRAVRKATEGSAGSLRRGRARVERPKVVAWPSRGRDQGAIEQALRVARC